LEDRVLIGPSQLYVDCDTPGTLASLTSDSLGLG
jgi:hypothetical protein